MIKEMRMKALFVALPLALSLGTAVNAADKHGGQEVQAGKYHVELVVKDRDISVHIRDDADKPLDAKSIKASANVLSGKEKATVELMPAGEALRGQAPFAVAKDAKVIVTFAVGGGKKEQARFSLGQKQEHKGHKH